MSKKPDELQAGALNAWTPLQQAALYQNYLSKVKENEEGERLKAYETAEAEKKKGPKVKPEAIGVRLYLPSWTSLVRRIWLSLGIWVPMPLSGEWPDRSKVDWIESLADHACDLRSVSPWYLHHLLVYPTLYLIPLFNAYVSISSRKDRRIW